MDEFIHVDDLKRLIQEEAMKQVNKGYDVNGGTMTMTMNGKEYELPLSINLSAKSNRRLFHTCIICHKEIDDAGCVRYAPWMGGRSYICMMCKDKEVHDERSRKIETYYNREKKLLERTKNLSEKERLKELLMFNGK